MFRARRLAVLPHRCHTRQQEQQQLLLLLTSSSSSSSSSLSLSQQCRHYTPIWQPDPAVNHVTSLRDEDECRTLWGSTSSKTKTTKTKRKGEEGEVITAATAKETLSRAGVPIPNVAAAVEAWIRFGNDPVLHTAIPVMHEGQYLPPTILTTTTTRTTLRGNALKGEGDSTLPQSTSPFAYAEDYMGTNMVFGSPEHVKDSVTVWANYFERRYTNQLRQSRRTVANHVGLVNAPEVFTDEADRPETKWSQDTFFRERAYMAEKFLKEKVSNMQQFERVLKRSGVDAYIAFHDALQQQTQMLIPLPSPSIWHYEGARRTQWAEKFIPLSQESLQFFEEVLAADLQRLHRTPEKILQSVSAVFAEVGKVLVRRHHRCLNGRTWSSLTSEEKDTFCMKEVWRWQQQVITGDFDPKGEMENSTEESPEWQSEHDTIMQLMNTKIDDLSFTALDFWKHTLRCEEMETEHIHTEKRIRDISAAAWKALYDTTPFEMIINGKVESIARGQLDMSASVFRPYSNDIWCQINYAKFGASTITQHTTTARRQLLFFHAGSLKEVAATATLYYATKPLSHSLDYSSPYKYRRSLVGLCTTYGVDMAHATQRPLLLSAAHLARAEDLIRTVVLQAARPFGERRRAAIKQRRTNYQRLLVPVEKVEVFAARAATSDLLTKGADPAETLEVKREKVNMWPLGSRRAISYDWQTSHLEKLKKAMPDMGVPLTAQRVKDIDAIKRSAFLEISLWRRVTPEEKKQRREQLEKEKQHVDELVRTIPQLAQVQKYANSLYNRIEEKVLLPINNTTTTTTTNNNNNNTDKKDNVNVKNDSDDDSMWEFAVMLDDRIVLNVEQEVELYLPFADANGVPLPQGEYRVRVRAYDTDINPTLDPIRCSESFSTPLQVFDALPQLIEQFFSSSSSKSSSASSITQIPGSMFIPFCEFLREAGVEVPLRCEFEAGQALSSGGDVYMDYFLHLLRSSGNSNGGMSAAIDEDISIADSDLLEPSCAAHWAVHHPGATAEEWAEARRRVLTRAWREEREWWWELSKGTAIPSTSTSTGMGRGRGVLDTADMATASTNSGMRGGLTLPSLPAARRDEILRVTTLTATAEYTNMRSGITAVCDVDGTGAAVSLQLTNTDYNNHNHNNNNNNDNNKRNNSDMCDIDDALATAQHALRSAQDRHNTLAAFRLGTLSKQSQMLLFCGINATEFAGKYARTYAYAFTKAKKELAEVALSGRVVPGVRDGPAGISADEERLSERESVDRFASSTHPEQRKTQFVTRIGPGGVPMEDPTPEQMSDWGR
ncbi:uncharacterized protein TM35_000192020 [Trypanosoma theileri]|uniref:Uncharacterized protein n=1 Tax=Trypanosoma theileri TaxID=67003 RepID=A0A1X0NTT9_9TRYP|nr:uncharacterized protein TM35_000192020 [Trypanosoma theileri]ORC87958.1 hypothetical protein TM35_000192020 [Trypanosoma theileri]